MLEKLIEYLKNLPKDEQERLLHALQDEQSTEQDNEQVQESAIQEKQAEQTEEPAPIEPVESETTEQTQTETTEEQEVQNVEENQKEENNEQVEEQQEQQEQATEQEQDVEQPEQDTKEHTEQIATENPPAFQELLETKIELALVKAGIREDRIEAAKRLFKTEIHSLEDLDKLSELVREFPEWKKVKKEQSASFGVPIKDSGNSLTEEEKKLKEMGIDPKN